MEIQPNVAGQSPGIGTGRKFYTVPEFCESHRISKSFIYKLWKLGRGPRITRLGTRRLISEEAAAAWRDAMTETAA
jgi:predicted DNA-binding transcriptional regulator AlpA